MKMRELDFFDAQSLFDGRCLYTFPSPRGTEARWVSVGETNGRLMLVMNRFSLRVHG
ncbi:MAG: BrnT family toxin [Nitrospirae bacterium]|nr:BrnT family toxin [Nitrospirota bacterium]